MAEAQDALSALLSNPEALSKAMDIAKTFMSSAPPPPPDAEPQEKPQEKPQEEPQESAPVSTARPPRTQMQSQDDNTRLLLALKPFLSEKRSKNVGTVLALMRAMQLLGATELFDMRGN